MVLQSSFGNLVAPDSSLPDYLYKKIRNHGDDVALVDNEVGASITFKEIHDLSRKLAAALNKRGLKKGDIAAIYTPNCVEFPVVVLGVTSCGAAICTCNHTYKEAEVLQQFKVTKPKFVIASKKTVKILENLAKELTFVQEIITIEDSEGYKSIKDLVTSVDVKDFPENVEIDPKDAFCIFYSSGTTGLPKGVVRTHRNDISNIIIMSSHFKMFRSSCCYAARPMYHGYGFCMLLTCLNQGVKLVFDSAVNDEKIFQTIETFKVTHLACVPPVIIMLAKSDKYKNYDTTSLKRVVCGGAPLAPDLFFQMKEKYCVVSSIYGMTEFVPISLSDPVTYDPSSVGSLMAHTSIKICDLNTGQELGPNEDGEILLNGPQGFKEYLNNPEATAAALDKDGWFRTGDLGHYDKDGNVSVTGRLKEIINYRGVQVPPAEIEAILINHPKVNDVGVIGIPHPEAGQVPKAFVVKRESSLTENEVKNYVAEKLSIDKHLRGGVVFIEAIPKNPTGKIERLKLKKLHEEQENN